MDKSALLITAMARRCKKLILNAQPQERVLPKPLQSKHLQWMCDQIEIRADVWPDTKLHRWIGFIQCGMMANRMLDLDGAKMMFDEVKLAHGEPVEDLLDHLSHQKLD